MDRALCCLLATALFGFVGKLPSACAQTNAITHGSVLGTDAPSKFENGLQIFWSSTSLPGDPPPGETDPEASVRVSDSTPRELVVCRLASAIQSFDRAFTGVSVYDVSARRPGPIAVAAVYSRRTGNPVSLLLYFDWSGSLTRLVAFSNRPPLRSLEVVSANSVWAMRDFDPEDRSRFTFVEFDRNGRAIQEAVHTHRSWSTGESMSKGGQTSFGISGDLIWAWLPKCQTLISFNIRDRRVSTKRTGLPRLSESSGLYARHAALLPNGQLLLDVGWISHGKRTCRWFTWSHQSGWNVVQSPIQNAYLCAVDGDRLIFEAPAISSGSLPVFQSELVSDLLARHATGLTTP